MIHNRSPLIFEHENGTSTTAHSATVTAGDNVDAHNFLKMGGNGTTTVTTTPGGESGQSNQSSDVEEMQNFDKSKMYVCDEYVNTDRILIFISLNRTG